MNDATLPRTHKAAITSFYKVFQQKKTAYKKRQNKNIGSIEVMHSDLLRVSEKKKKKRKLHVNYMRIFSTDIGLCL